MPGPDQGGETVPVASFGGRQTASRPGSKPNPPPRFLYDAVENAQALLGLPVPYNVTLAGRTYVRTTWGQLISSYGEAATYAFAESLLGNDKAWIAGYSNFQQGAANRLLQNLDLSAAQKQALSDAINGSKAFTTSTDLPYGQLTPGDVYAILKQQQALDDEAGRRAAFLAKHSDIAANLDQLIAAFVAGQRAQFERETPTLTAAERKQLAPWLYGDNSLLAPGLDLDAQGNSVIAFLPTPQLITLERSQAIALTTLSVFEGGTGTITVRTGQVKLPQSAETSSPRSYCWAPTCPRSGTRRSPSRP